MRTSAWNISPFGPLIHSLISVSSKVFLMNSSTLATPFMQRNGVTVWKPSGMCLTISVTPQLAKIYEQRHGGLRKQRTADRKRLFVDIEGRTMQLAWAAF